MWAHSLCSYTSAIPILKHHSTDPVQPHTLYCRYRSWIHNIYVVMLTQSQHGFRCTYVCSESCMMYVQVGERCNRCCSVLIVLFVPFALTPGRHHWPAPLRAAPPWWFAASGAVARVTVCGQWGWGARGLPHSHADHSLNSSSIVIKDSVQSETSNTH